MLISKALGRRLSIKELAELLDISEQTIYRNPQRYGGAKIGGRLLFFEKWVVEALENQRQGGNNANIQNNQRQKNLDWKSGQEIWPTIHQTLQNQAGGNSLGADAEKAIRRKDPNRHNLW
jgi:hypothetical protein